MAVLSVNIPAGVITRVQDAYAGVYSYQPLLADGVTPNPQTKAAFIQQKVIEYMKTIVNQWEVQQASAAAAKTAGDKVAAEIVLS